MKKQSERLSSFMPAVKARNQVWLLTGQNVPAIVTMSAMADDHPFDASICLNIANRNLKSGRYTDATLIIGGAIEIRTDDKGLNTWNSNLREMEFTGTRQAPYTPLPIKQNNVEPKSALHDDILKNPELTLCSMWRADCYDDETSDYPTRSILFPFPETLAVNSTGLNKLTGTENPRPDQIIEALIRECLTGRIWISTAGMGTWQCPDAGPETNARPILAVTGLNIRK